jgi:hypothetical protein
LCGREANRSTLMWTCHGPRRKEQERPECSKPVQEQQLPLYLGVYHQQWTRLTEVGARVFVHPSTNSRGVKTVRHFSISVFRCRRPVR